MLRATGGMISVELWWRSAIFYCGNLLVEGCEFASRMGLRETEDGGGPSGGRSRVSPACSGAAASRLSNAQQLQRYFSLGLTEQIY